MAVLAITSLAACGRAPSSTPHYTLETVVSFGEGGGSELFRGKGWGLTERRSTWTEGHRAELNFKVAPTKHPLGIRMRMSGIGKPPELPHQPVEAVVNGRSLAHWNVGKMEDFILVVPLELLSNTRDLKVEFRIPRATSPKALGYNADSRVLGICMHELQMTNAVPFADIWPSRAIADRGR